MSRGCTQCGECLRVCPIFALHGREEYSPKAKRLLLEPLIKGEAPLDWEQVKDLARLCAGCGKCREVCARKLSVADLLAEVRAQHPHWTQQFWELWIQRMGFSWPVLGKVAQCIPSGVLPQGLNASLTMAKHMIPPKPVQPWVRIAPNHSVSHEAAPVVLFSGCTANYIRQGWTRKSEELLALWGYSVLDASGFSCCGGTLHHAGQLTAMQQVRMRNMGWWRTLGKPRIAVFCASCYRGLLEYTHDTSLPDGEEWKKSIIPLSSLLHDVHSEVTNAAPVQYGYHQPCHWQEMDADMTFLQKILPAMEQGRGLCCGMGGILKMSNGELSAALARRCLDEFDPNITDIITGCSGCVLQLGAFASAPVRVMHWLDMLEPAQSKTE